MSLFHYLEARTRFALRIALLLNVAKRTYMTVYYQCETKTSMTVAHKSKMLENNGGP